MVVRPIGSRMLLYVLFFSLDPLDLDRARLVANERTEITSEL